jgi:hypothetical protein
VIANRDDLAEIVCKDCHRTSVSCNSEYGLPCKAFEKLWDNIQIKSVKQQEIKGCQNCSRWFPNVPKEPAMICCKGSYDNSPCNHWEPKEE